MANELLIQLNEHLKEAYYELGALYTELADDTENQYIKDAIDLVRKEKDNIISQIKIIEDKNSDQSIRTYMNQVELEINEKLINFQKKRA